MKRPFWVLPVVFSSVLFVDSGSEALAQSCTTCACSNTDIMAVGDAMVQGIADLDVQALADLYSNSAGIYGEFTPTTGGSRANIEQFWVDFFDAGLVSLVLTHTESCASGVLGFDVGTYSYVLDDGTGPVTYTGRYMLAMKKVNGQWLIVHDMDNTP
jgi:ketosteroid isomerase-like protein